MLAIYKRELRSYFLTSVAYVYLATLFVFFGMFFLFNNVLARVSYMGPAPISGNFAPVFGQMLIILLFLTPVLTMKLLSEERRQKTDQLLHTVPTSTFEIVLAKYLSALTVFSTGMVISMIYPALIHFMADAPVKSLISAYLGFYLVGACFIAICVFASAITESQFISALVGFGIILGMWFMEFLASYIKPDESSFFVTLFRTAFDSLAIVSRFSDFQSGIIKLASVIYYLSWAIFFLFLTMRTIDKRRWTEG